MSNRTKIMVGIVLAVSLGASTDHLGLSFLSFGLGAAACVIAVNKGWI